MAAPKELEVGYWSIRGLGAPCRMMVLYAGVDLKAANYDAVPTPEGTYDRSDWGGANGEKQRLIKKNPLINLPYVIDAERDVIVTQSNACMAYLGRRLNLLGSTEKEHADCDQLLSEAMDLRNDLVRNSYGGEDADRVKLIQGKLQPNSSFQKLENWLARKANDCFFVGGSATAPDFHIWEMCDQYSAMSKHVGEPDLLDSFPHLQNFHKSFAAQPQMQRYFEHPVSKFPFNNTMAKFGATPALHGPCKPEEFTWGKK